MTRFPSAVLSWLGIALIVAVVAFSLSWAVTSAVLDHHGGPSHGIEAKFRATRM